jgi:hypothetical protein
MSFPITFLNEPFRLTAGMVFSFCGFSAVTTGMLMVFLDFAGSLHDLITLSYAPINRV